MLGTGVDYYLSVPYVYFYAIIFNKEQDLDYVKPLGIEEIQKGLGTISSSRKPT